MQRHSVRRTIFPCILILATAALFLSCSKTPAEKIEALYKSGVERLAKYDFDGALKVFEEIKTIDSTSPFINYGQGLVAEQRLWTVDAFIPYAQIMKDSPDSPLGYAGGYRVQKRLGEYDDALTTADELGKKSPKDPAAIATLAEASMLASLPQLSKRLIDSARRVGLADGEADFLVARALFLMHDFDSAKYYAASALKKSGKDARYFERAADYYETVGLADSAMLFSEQELNAKSDLPFQWIHHFDRAMRLGYFATARSVLSSLGKQGVDSSVLYGVQAAYLIGAERYLEGCNASIWMANFAPPNNLTRATYEMSARLGMSSSPQMMEVMLSIQELLEGKNYISIAHQFFASYFYTEFASYSPSELGIQMMDLVYGPATLRRETRIAKARLQYERGYFKRFDSLVAGFDRFQSRFPDWQADIGDIYAEQGPTHYDEAMPRYEKALALDSMYAAGFAQYVTTLERFGMYDKVEALFERFPYFAEQYSDLAVRRAAALVRLGRRAEAMPIFEAAISKRSGDMRAVKRYLMALDFMFDQEGRSATIDILARLAPDNPDILVLLADRALDSGDYATGLNFANEGLKRDPDYTLLLTQKARGVFGSGKQSEAIALLDSLYPNNQNDPEYVYEFSKLLTDNKTDLNKAANLARGAAYYSNSSLEKMLHLSHVYYVMGRYDLAWTEAANVCSAYPTSPEAFFRRGLAAKALGRPEAKEMFEKSISLGLAGPYLADAKRELAGLN